MGHSMKSLKQQTDEELMALIQAFNHEAFSELVTRHSDRFYALSYRTLFHQSDAEDIVQESFLKLWRKPTLWQPKRGVQFKTWFYRIIVNACYDLNKKKSSQESSLIDQDYEQLAEEDNGSQQRSNLSTIEAALKNLPERQRTALNLCFYEELSNKEAADIMGIRLKALQSLIMRAKTTLKAQINIAEEDGYEHK
jgi:RNA polymerase sigma-70 factor (ECF subfamily)